MLTLLSKIKQDELCRFTRQLATLLQSGLPLVRGLEVLEQQESNIHFKKTIHQIASTIRSGGKLSEGLNAYPRIFNHIYINMVSAGEASGALDAILDRLATYMERSIKTKRKLKSAMLYPMVVMSVALIIVSMLMLFVVPKFQNIFHQMLGDSPLPALTHWLIEVSHFFQHNILMGSLTILVLILTLRGLYQLPTIRLTYDHFILKLPKIGSLINTAIAARFSRTLGTLLKSGVPILEALNITHNILGNRNIQQSLMQVHKQVRDGEALAASLEKQNIFPPMITSMIAVGEETGQLPEMLDNIANHVDESLDHSLANISSIIEPVMIVGLSIVVGSIVIALFLPIIGIIDKLAVG